MKLSNIKKKIEQKCSMLGSVSQTETDKLEVLKLLSRNLNQENLRVSSEIRDKATNLGYEGLIREIDILEP